MKCVLHDRIRVCFALFLLLSVGCAARARPAIARENRAAIEVHFAPLEKLAPIVVRASDAAHSTLDIAAFGFTHPDIAAAVIRAHQRGVRVRIVMDPTSAADKSSLASTFDRATVPFRLAGNKHAFQHSKYMVIDAATVITGSFNFTIRGDARNSENLLIIRHAPDVVAAFKQDYRSLVADSVPYIAP